MEATSPSPPPGTPEAMPPAVNKPPAEAAPSAPKEPSVDMTPSTDATASAPREPWINVTTSMQTKASREGMQSTETMVSGEISSSEPSTPIWSPSYRNILVLGRNNPIFDVLGVTDTDGAVLFLVLASVLYALLTPWLLWRVASQPLALVWTTSLLSSSYFLIGTICLSETMGCLGVFLRFSCATSLAVAGAHLIGPISGVAIASLVTFYGAGMLGYSIGEYLQRVGIETSADLIASRPLRDEEREKRKEEWLCVACFMQGGISLLVLARMAWVVFVPGSVPFNDPLDEPLFVVGEFSMETLFLAWMWSSIVALAVLEEAFVSADTMLYKGLAFYVASCILNSVLLIAKCNAASLLFLWTISMAMVGFFGYCLAVYARYEHIRPRNQPVSASTSVSQDGPSKLDQQPSLPKKELDALDEKPTCCLLQELGEHNQKPGLHIRVDELD